MTTTIAIAMVKDEADIVRSTVGHMRTQVDHVVVADNGSTDNTREILHDLGVEVLDDPDVGYYQSKKMTTLAEYAGRMGADWIVPFDADEWWYSPYGRIADVLAHIKPRATVATAELYDHVATGADPHIPDPVKRIGWRRPYLLPLVKVAFRYQNGVVVEQGNHNASYPDPDDHRVILNRLMIRHFPYRSVEHFVRKVRNGAAAYRATEGLAADAGAHWRQWGDLLDRDGEEAIAAIFHTWYYRCAPDRELMIGGELQPALVYDPAR